MVSVNNLCDLIKTCIEPSCANGQVFWCLMVMTCAPRVCQNDGRPYAAIDTIALATIRLAYGLGKIPSKKPEIGPALVNSLQVDIQPTCSYMHGCHHLQWMKR